MQVIRDLYPDNPVAYGLTTLTSELRGPGHIEASYAGRGETFFQILGAVPEGLGQKICALLTSARGQTLIDPDIDLRIWKKNSS